MTNRSKQRGTAAESAVVGFLRRWWPYAERRALRGVNDLGDIAGVPGVVIEVKSCREWRVSEWVRDTERKAAGCGCVPVVVVKAPGKGDMRVGEWFAITTLAHFAALVANDTEAGAA